MRIIFRSAVLAVATLCTTAAFAAEKTTVNIPFSFESHGQIFPAGRYLATLDTNSSLLTLSSMNDIRKSARWTAGPADCNPQDWKLTLKFDDQGHTHVLHSMQLGPRITSVLDAPAGRRNAGSIEAAVSGQ